MSVRVLSFEHLYSLQDPTYEREAVETYARRLRNEFAQELEKVMRKAGSIGSPSGVEVTGNGRGTTEVIPPVKPVANNSVEGNDVAEPVDVLELYRLVAIRAIQEDQKTWAELTGSGVPWGALNRIIREALPPSVDEPGDTAYQLVPKALDAIFGPKREGRWHTFRSPQRTTYVKAGAEPGTDHG
jgi:hypothetical protein